MPHKIPKIRTRKRKISIIIFGSQTHPIFLQHRNLNGKRTRTTFVLWIKYSKIEYFFGQNKAWWREIEGYLFYRNESQ
jgi:hypothetical protein